MNLQETRMCGRGGWICARWAGVGLTVLLLGACAANPVDWIHGGETLMPAYRTPPHELDYKRAGLPPPPMGFRWYRVDRDYVLANRTTGLILKSMPAPADPPSAQPQPPS